MNKGEVHQAVILYLNTKIEKLKEVLKDAYEAAAADGKSSAGDKHETATSMAQLEQEKLTHQLNELLEQKNILDKINPARKHTSIDFGSLVQTESGWFYFSVGLGVIKHNQTQLYCINPFAPIGILLKGKKAGDSFLLNSKENKVILVS